MARRRLRDMAAEPGLDPLAAANGLPDGGSQILELDPDSLLDDGGLADRLNPDAEDVEFLSLVDSIRADGQRVPILVRPHPTAPGAYQIIAGRRRAQACRLAGLRVRAEVREMDDRDLVLSQVIENIARKDLTYIERARLVVMMTDAGYNGAEVIRTFACGRSELSRYLKIGRTIPDDVASWIGRAPDIGRPRWEKLAVLLEDGAEALGRVQSAIAAADYVDPAGRFGIVWKAAATNVAPTPPRVADLRGWTSGPAFGRIRTTPRGVEITLPFTGEPGIAEWVADHPDQLADLLVEVWEKAAKERPRGRDT